MTKNTLSNLIDTCQLNTDRNGRGYIGASSIGSECLRQIWYELNGFCGESVSTKLSRTWEIGNRLEIMVLDLLEDAGIDLFRNYGELQSTSIHYFKGNVDALMLMNGEPYQIIEIKTAKHSSFNVFVNKGLRIWMPQYYAQIQAYLGLYKENTLNELNSASILVLNKDNSELSDENVQFDEVFYESLKYKAKMVYEYETEPPRINNSPAYYKCKMCKFRRTCHK